MSSHLLELQKEIKEEEEEIFADINSLINSRSNLLYSTLDDYDDGNDNNFEDDELRLKCLEREEIRSNRFSPTILNHHHHNLRNSNNANNINNKFNNNNNNNSSSINLSSDYHSNTDDQLFATDNSDDLIGFQSVEDTTTTTTTTQDYQNDSARSEHEPQNRLHNHHHYYRFDDSDQTSNDFITHNDDIGSHYLHEEQYDKDSHEQANHENDDPHYMNEQTFVASHQDQQQDYHALQAVIQQVTSNLPKPCVFFLEGNCRRSDCKYSHDLSNITCKYWIEGFCFKGELCPFLHSYNPLSDSQDPSLLDDDGLPKKLNPTFAIDSEADFPSLPLDAPAGALNDSTTSNINEEAISTTIKDQILSSNPAIVFKTLKKKRKRG